MDKVLEALERLKTAPTFMGGTAEYQACTKSETLLMQDYEIVKQFILKAQEQELHNGGRLPNKEILSLKHCVEQYKDKPILYISETYGNKYIVPQKELDDLTKENARNKEILQKYYQEGITLDSVRALKQEKDYYKKALEIIKEKNVNMFGFKRDIKQLGNRFTYKYYQSNLSNYHSGFDIQELTEEEFELLRSVLE